MLLTLDVEEMRCSIDLWRRVLALTGQSSDQLAHVIADARGTVAGWADLLRREREVAARRPVTD